MVTQNVFTLSICKEGTGEGGGKVAKSLRLCTGLVFFYLFARIEKFWVQNGAGLAPRKYRLTNRESCGVESQGEFSRITGRLSLIQGVQGQIQGQMQVTGAA